jgi:hypothetical protein
MNMENTFYSLRFAALATAVLTLGLSGQSQAQVGPAGVSAGIQTWLDASALAPNSSAVTVWADKSGNSRDAQVSTGSAAQYEASGLNGKPALSFTGTQGYVVNGLDIRAAVMPDVTVFTVYKQGSASSNALWGNDNGNWDRFVYTRFNFEAGIISTSNPSGPNSLILGGSVAGGAYLSTAVYDGQVSGGSNAGPADGSAVYVNGEKLNTFTDYTDPLNAATSLRLGSDGDNGGFTGAMAEVIVYNRILSDCEMKSVNAYLNAKYSLGMAPTVLAPSAPAIAIAPASGPNTGGIATNYYLGYGPQTATLTASGAGAGASYAWTGSAGAPALANAGTATPTFTASAAGTFTYTVTATNASGCSKSANITLNVVDARCDKNKVVVCHNGGAICVAAASVDAHLRNYPSDRLGDCAGNAKGTAAPAPVAVSSNLMTYPNPAAGQATVSFQAPLDGQAQVVVYDRMGTLVATLYNGTVKEGQQFSLPLDSRKLTSGLYQCRLVMNGKAESVQLQVQL